MGEGYPSAPTGAVVLRARALAERRIGDAVLERLLKAARLGVDAVGGVVARVHTAVDVRVEVPVGPKSDISFEIGRIRKEKEERV